LACSSERLLVIETSENTTDDGEALALEGSDPEPTEAGEQEPVSDLLEEVGRATATLFFREIELATARRSPELRRAAHDIAAALGAALALLTAFALGNWAAVSALSLVLPDWLAALVLALAWIVVGLLLLALARPSAQRAPGRQWWRALGADQDKIVAECEQARDEARQATRDSLERLTGTLAREAGEQVAQAAIPLAGGVVSAGEGIIDATDEITDAIEEAVPGGTVVNRAVDVVLVPGRLVIKVSRTLLARRDR
jgi:Putative Actinobacterial Holin-X, holin superfamily III